MKHTLTLAISFCLLFLSSSFKVEPVPNSGNYYNYGIPISQLVNAPIQKQNFSILVQKSSYTLFLKYNGRLIKSYPCVFGENPIGDKLMQGDNSTPEGNFTLTDIREHFIWGYFMEIDYPNGDSWVKHNDAKYTRVIPETADIGGSVGLHGVVDGLEAFVDTKNNWTEGCVSLKNNDIVELAQNLAVGTPVKIVY